MDRITRNVWDNVDTLPIKFEKYIRANGILTGSKVFGGFASGTSDIDIILRPTKDISFMNLLMKGLGCYASNTYVDKQRTYSSLYVRCSFTKHPVNLLLVNDEYMYDIFVEVTESIAFARQDPVIRTFLLEKENRSMLFEALKAHLINSRDDT